jgi:hypothetical protein
LILVVSYLQSRIVLIYLVLINLLS